MKTLVFFLEEPSAKAMLEGVLPRIFPDSVVPRYIVFKGKQDLEKQLVKRMKGWNQPDTQFVVLREQDSGDCKKIKGNLLQKCSDAGHPECLVRIACRELESWYLGDLQAVEDSLKIPRLARQQNSKKFRVPDNLTNAAEELVKVTHQKYFKLSGSRLIGPHLNLDNNKSVSFNVFLDGIKKLTGGEI